MNTIAIIPARLGSKRLPNKNLLVLGGQPLIHWTIMAAVRSEVFSNIVVTSDSDEILNIAALAGVVAHSRESLLCQDNTSSAEVVLDALQQNMDPQQFCLLQPTSPLRNHAHIIEALALYKQTENHCLVSVCALDHPIEWSGLIDKDRILQGLKITKNTRSQDLPKRFRLNGAIYIRDTTDFLRNKLLVTDQPLAYEMAREHSVDIDEYVDFKVAEGLLEMHLNPSS